MSLLERQAFEFSKGIERKICGKIKKYPNSFMGFDGITWLLNNFKLISRNDALIIAQDMMDKGYLYNLNSFLKSDKYIDNNKYYYAFNDEIINIKIKSIPNFNNKKSKSVRFIEQSTTEQLSTNYSSEIVSMTATTNDIDTDDEEHPAYIHNKVETMIIELNIIIY